MTRRSSSTLALSAVAACALVLTSCGEQTPGGMPDEGHQVAQAAGHEEQDGQGDQAEQTDQAAPAEQDDQLAGADAAAPIVVKIGDDEFRTTMAIYRRYDEAKGGPLALHAPVAAAEELDGGKKQDYTAGTIFWHPDTGAHIVRGEILATYLDNGGPSGRLGWPVGDETIEDEAIYSDFQRGQIRLENQSIRIVEQTG